MTQYINGNAGKIEVLANWKEQADCLAVVCHPHPLFGGTMDNKVVTTLTRFADAQGMHSLRFNFRGVGNSEGEHDNAIGEIEDVMAVLAWASTQTDIKNLWLAGFSFGGYVMAKVAERLISDAQFATWHIQKLTLVAPAVSRDYYDVTHLKLPTNKTHVIYGSADEVVDPQAIAKFATNYGLQTSVLDDAGHFFHRRLVDLRQVLTVA